MKQQKQALVIFLLLAQGVMLMLMGCASTGSDSGADPEDLSSEETAASDDASAASGDLLEGGTSSDPNAESGSANSIEQEFLTEPDKSSQPQDQLVQENTSPPPLQESPNGGDAPILPSDSAVGSVMAPPAVEVEITGLKYKSNDNGGTVVIEATGPMTYTTRENPDLKQFIVEVSPARLPERLKRPLNTRDFAGSIGSIDPYQTPNTKTARFVIQLREGATTPFVQSEGNSLLVVSSENAEGAIATASSLKKDNEEALVSAETESPEDDVNINLNDSRILSSQSLADFLAGNTKFYGKRISIEFPAATPVQTAIRFFMEETGINMIIDEDVGGTVSMKLRQVPWDQAFVIMLKMAKLSYQRQGSILRIATVRTLQTEEKEAKEQAELTKLSLPLKVRNFFVNFAKVGEVKDRIEEMLVKNEAVKSRTTKVITDERNGKLIVQDTEENLDLIDKIIKNLDMPTKQVLIEGKIVEATEKFAKGIGIQWGLSGQEQQLGAQKLSANLGIGTPSTAGRDLGLGINFGTIPILGDLNATLSLSEIDNKVKVIASPRVMTLTDNAANVNVTSQVVSKVATVTVNPASGGTTNRDEFQTVSVPITMSVTPKVTPDNFVSMKINVSRGVANINADGRATVDTRSVDSNVLVRDGQAAVIGGLYLTDTNEGTTGVPGLKDIPFIGGLFRTRSQTKQKTELLIFLTPRIINQEIQASGANENVNL